MRTNVPHIFAIGDIVGQPMLAHKATHEGKVAAEVAGGRRRASSTRASFPSVAYTDPEIAWVGLTEDDAKARGVAYEKATFPWAASGRSLSLGRDGRLHEALVRQDDASVLGAGIVGTNAGDLIAEAALAIEMGADARTSVSRPSASDAVGDDCVLGRSGRRHASPICTSRSAGTPLSGRGGRRRLSSLVTSAIRLHAA